MAEPRKLSTKQQIAVGIPLGLLIVGIGLAIMAAGWWFWIFLVIAVIAFGLIKFGWDVSSSVESKGREGD